MLGILIICSCYIMSNMLSKHNYLKMYNVEIKTIKQLLQTERPAQFKFVENTCKPLLQSTTMFDISMKVHLY